VKITSLPAQGTLKLNGVAVQVDAVISKTDLDAGKLKYQGALNGNGSNYASFQFKVQDSRASNNEDTTANKLTFNLAAVNDAAVIIGTIFGAVTEAGGVANATAGTPTATGTLTSTDVDGTANSFTAVTTDTATTGGYGTYTMTAGGAWTYTLNNSNATVQALASNVTLTDTFTVRAADGTAKVVSVTITGANDAPVVAFALPDQTAVFAIPFSYTVPSGSFTDWDSTLTYTATLGDGSALPAWLTFNAASRTFSGTPTSTTDLIVKVTASDGVASVSDTFLMALAPVASSVAITSSTGIQNNFLNAGDTVTATVNFSEWINVTGTPQLTLNIGGAMVRANYVSGSGTSALNFRYTILAGQADVNGISIGANALEMNGGTITDAGGKNATQNFAALTDNSSYKVDTTAPNIGTLTFTDTGSSSTDGISQNGTITVGGLESGATWSYSTDNGKTWTAGIGTSFTLSQGSYAAGAVQIRQTDLAGNVQTGSQIAKIANAVVIDLSAPILLTSTPADNSYVSALASDITLTFNEAVYKGIGTISLYNASNTLIQSFDVATSTLVTGWNGTTLTVNPTNNLVAGTSYYMKVDATAIRDAAGNAYAGISNNSELNFTTPATDGSVGSGGGYSGAGGTSLSNAGDVNGDGFDDIIVGTNNAAYVIYGNASGNMVNLSSGAIAADKGFKVIGGAGSGLGTDVSGAGDINGDGLADVLVGAPGSKTTYVVYGSPNGNTVDLVTGNIASNVGFKITGGTSNFGYSVSNSGDLNGDGLADMIVGEYGNNGGMVGAAWAIYGSKTRTNIDMANISGEGFLVNGQTTYATLGFAVSGAGDVNGDGLADLIVGSPAHFDNGTLRNGAAYVIYGKSSFTTGVNLNWPTPGAIAPSNGFKISGELYSKAGTDVSSAGDVNGDGLADLIVGSRFGGTSGSGKGSNEGAAYIVFGNSTGTGVNLASLAASNGFKITGSAASALGEHVASAGDVNGDGLGDLLVSGLNSSFAYVVYGASSGVALNLSNGTIAGSRGFKLTNMGGHVSTAGDVNGDGLADLLVGYPSGGNGYNVVLGGTQWVTSAVDGAGTFGGTSASEALIGSAGSDTITGGGGVDRFFAGAGNDTIVLTTNDMTNLANNAVGAQKASISGGNGFDTIRLTGGTNMNLTTISNVGAMGLEENSRIESIERIDLGTDTAANTLTLMARDVKDMAGFNVIHTGSVSADGNTWTNVTGSALSAITQYHQLVVDGTAADSVVLAADLGAWVNVGTVSDGTSNYTLYQNAGTNSQVLVKTGVVVTNNDPAPFTGGSVAVNGVTMTLDYQWIQNGKTYFAVKNFSGTGDSNNNTMYATHTLLDSLFNGGSDTVDVAVSAGVDNARTFLSNGYTFVLPTQAELVALSNTIPTTGWYNARYWSSTLSSANNHTSVGIAGDWIYTSADSTPEMVALQVLPVIIDLNRDGVLSYGQVSMDVNGDRHLDTTKWAGSQDGVLVWDKYVDGLVHDNSQYAFSQYGAAGSTDLQGLAAVFDTNHDGVFDAQDVQFSEFKVWQDANQNGVSDAGEVRSLADVGINAIHLVSDGVVRAPLEGVTEAGRTTATTADGASVLVSDAAFSYQSVSYSMQGTALSLNGSNMRHDLSSFVSLHGAVDAVDLSGAGDNTLKIGLQDVLRGTTSGSLWVKGDADDKVLMDATGWKDVGHVMGQDGHTYVQFTNGTAHLFVDQSLGLTLL
jgi:VCBS repeat-containing protein